jgi:hypothetical protein
MTIVDMKKLTTILGTAVVSAVTMLATALPGAAQTQAQAPEQTQAQAPAQTPAPWTGAVGVNTLAGWQQMNQQIGPSHTARVYYADGLPASWSDTTNFCSSLPDVLCVISYHTEEKTQAAMNAFVGGIKANRPAPVFLVYYDEPEAHISSSQFLSGYENQVDEIRAACAIAGNCGVVKVGMIASSYQYQAGERGYSCAYIPPAKYVDVYFADTYEPVLVGLQNDTGFQRWATCAKAEGSGVVLGLTEYGLGICVASGTFTEKARAEQLAADAAYLSAHYPHLYEWEYYWHQGASAGGCKEYQFPAGPTSPTATEWQAIEQGTVSS